MQNNVSGIVLLNKKIGLTSFNSLNLIKKSLNKFCGSKVKVGHTGTLDSFAEGLLVVVTGKFTKLNSLMTYYDKTYEAVIQFGTQTDTLDPGGKVIKTAEIPDFDLIAKKINCFRGQIKQRPPIFSAIHVNGERAYKMAVKGSTIEMPERQVEIYSFEILDWKAPYLKCKITCSKGTYIRAIARDLGYACNSCACLLELKRTNVGPFDIARSISAENFVPSRDIITGREIFTAIGENIMSGILDLKQDYLNVVKNGGIIKNFYFTESPNLPGKYAVFFDDTFIAFIEYKSDSFSYIFVG